MFLCWFQQQDVGSSLSESQEPKPLSLTLRRGNSTNTTQNQWWMSTQFCRLKSWVLIQVNKNWTKIGFDFQNQKQNLY
jgi:hypothetical protein